MVRTLTDCWPTSDGAQIGDKEITLDDVWSLDLNKLHHWRLVKEVSVPEQEFKTGYASSNDGDDDDDDDEGDDGED